MTRLGKNSTHPLVSLGRVILLGWYFVAVVDRPDKAFELMGPFMTFESCETGRLLVMVETSRCFERRLS